MSKPLTQQNVQKALVEGFGLSPEAANFDKIGALSQGQQIRVVMAAATWQNPHILVLDEPTNYLDRTGLRCLTEALKTFLGGVVIISHSKEFADEVSDTKWEMEKGRLREVGEVVVDEEMEEKLRLANEEEENGSKTFITATGEEIEIKKQKNTKKTEKDLKKQLKDLEKELRDGKRKFAFTDAERWTLEDRIDEIKEELGMEIKK